ncbi:MAG: HNH endonuclease [Verrucomicrobiota bacterium]|jgi:hypothetical protein
MLKRKFTIEEVAQASKAAIARLLPDLPPEIGGRLKPQRVAVRHGSETRMFLYYIWDKAQPSILDYRHFSYGVIYDPTCRYHTWKRDMGGPCNLLGRFYMNRHRIYDKADSVVSALWKEMANAEKALYGYMKHQNDQMIGLFRYFDANSVEELEEHIYQAFLELMPYWHPKYAAVIDSYGAKLTPAQVEAVIAGRKKFQPSGARHYQPDYRYNRHVPTRLREAVFERDGQRCLYPGCNAADTLHADHILPVAKGGTTVFENLQTLCEIHNLTKGDRESIDYRKLAHRAK